MGRPPVQRRSPKGPERAKGGVVPGVSASWGFGLQGPSQPFPVEEDTGNRQIVGRPVM